MKFNLLKNLFWFALGSFIALLICINEVYAEDQVIPNLAFRIYQNSNWQNITTESNAWVAPGNVLLEVGSQYSKIGGDGTLPPYLWVRMCQQNENLRASDISTLEFGIGTAESARLIYTTTPCTPVGTDFTGVQVVAEWAVSNGNGYDCYVDLDINNHVCNINTAMAFTVDQYGGYGEVYFGYSYQPLSLTDAEKIVEEGIGTLVEQNQIIIETQQETNQKLESIENALTDSSIPDVSNFAQDYAGYFPAGPLDSIVNMPKTLLIGLLDDFNLTCQPIDLPLPFVNKTITIPCMNTFYRQIPTLKIFTDTIGVIAMVLIIFRYSYFLSNVKDGLLTLSFDDLELLSNPYSIRRGR